MGSLYKLRPRGVIEPRLKTEISELPGNNLIYPLQRSEGVLSQ